MKIKIWTFIIDGGDGEHHVHIYPTREAGISAENIIDDGESVLFDEYDYPVEINCVTFDTENCEVIS